MVHLSPWLFVFTVGANLAFAHNAATDISSVAVLF
jgi:hypothetical protein